MNPHQLRLARLKLSRDLQAGVVTTPVNPPPPVTKPVKTTLDTDVVIILGAVLCVLIFAIWVHSVIRCLIRRNRRLEVAAGAGAINDDISTVGLDPKTIAALPIVPVSLGDSTDTVIQGNDPVRIQEGTQSGNTECIVCLQEFKDGEDMKLLPNCGHGFHVDCIGAWLTGHSSCPICRHGVLEPPSSPSNSFSASSSSGAFLLSSPTMRQMQVELSIRNLEIFQQQRNRIQRERDQLQPRARALQSVLAADRGLIRLFSRSNASLNLNSNSPAPPQP